MAGVGSLDELVSDCTCPVCCELLHGPVRLRCGHTFCRRCVQKLLRTQRHEAEPSPFSMLMPFPLFSAVAARPDRRPHCPVCRASFSADEAPESDADAEKLLDTLRLVRSDICADADCWQPASVACGCCQRRLCGRHHAERLKSLRDAAGRLRAEVGEFVQRDAGGSQLEQLQQQRRRLPELRTRLRQQLEARLQLYERQLSQCEAELLAAGRSPDQQQQILVQDERLRRDLEADDLASAARLLRPLSEQLSLCKRQSPPRFVEAEFDPNRLQLELDSLLGRIATGTYVNPYDSRSATQPALAVGTGQQLLPWDLDLLTNVEGVVIVDKLLRLRSDHPEGRQLPGPCLVVNFRSFPTGQLHLLDAEAKELAAIRLELKQLGMAGRFHVCNERQLIVSSDAGKDKLMVSRLDGKLLHVFGAAGRSDSELRDPLGLWLHESLLYVADSSNRRIQLFDADKEFGHVGSIRHDEFSENVCAVLVNDSVVVAGDQDRHRLFLFDRQSRGFKRQVPMEGPVFDLAADGFGNILVSLGRLRKIQVISPEGTVRIKTFSFAEEKQQHRSGTEGEDVRLGFMSLRLGAEGVIHDKPHALHGLALDPRSRRLFVADTYRMRILVAEL